MTRIKLCGIRRPEDVVMVNRLRPDYVGFVFWPGSKRAVDAETAGRLREMLSPEIRTVGVFVDEAPESIAALMQRGIISAAQLHGHETEKDIRALREQLRRNGARGGAVWQAFVLRSREQLQEAAESTADCLLLDAGRGEGGSFDWSWLRDFARPYFLAGGLTAENVGAAVRELQPYGVDVSSALEVNGVKDFRKMSAFVQAVRQTEGEEKQ